MLQENRVRLFVDEKLVADEAVHRNDKPPVEGRLAVGRLVEGGLECYGTIVFVQLLAGIADFTNFAADGTQQVAAQYRCVAIHFDDHTPKHHTSKHHVANRSAAAVPVAYDANQVKELAKNALAHGKAERGVAVFASARMACLSCHKIGKPGGSVGPELTLIGKQRTPEHIAESVLWPNQHVEDKYKVFQVLTAEGLTMQGYKVSESDTELVLRDPTSG